MVLLFIKIVSLIVTFCIVVAIIILAIETRKLSTNFVSRFIGPLPKGRPHGHGPPPAEKFASRLHQEASELWAFSQKALDSGLEGELKSNILSLDSFCDEILKDRGYGGETMGERLKEATLDGLPAIQRLWTAHRIRNRFAHTPKKVSAEELKQAVGWYGSVLREWRFIV